MRFTRGTYKRAYRRLIDASVAAWMKYSESDDTLDREAYRLIMHRADLVVARALREKGMWY